LKRWRETGGRLGMVECLEGLAGVAVANGQHDVAARLFGASTSWRATLGTPLAPVDRPRIERAVASARAAIGQGRFETAAASGAAMALDDLVETAATIVENIERATGRAEPRRLASTLELTPRELDVLRLIAAHKSNAEIADHLFISLRTVTTHVDRIFNKLGINSRVAAAVYAVQRGLA
jgi:DNA-binding CsgD family transcriptional regulator